ncbi:ribonuclease Z [Paenibacillus doosanensis]|uniref:MBL fold metallo-hydrolase n=1 Tax=Paenibacillus doosanensis TaxID=1229154 RepID=UPI00218053E8|nr:ribonuclease Z [Paenibacillus doosanensis]MCS7464821.1 ribonuclease Z [Paenibacillus doosanensis]
MNIICMGTASAAGSADRDNTYLLVQHEEDCILIDVGGNPLGKLKKLRIPLNRISEVVFTHFHIDHIYGLPSLLWGMWIAGREDALTIRCSKSNEAQLRSLLHSYQTASWPIRFDIRIALFDDGAVTQLFDRNGLTMTAFPSLHAGPTVGLKLVHDGKVTIYSADTRPNEWIREQSPVHTLIHEATTAADSSSQAHSSLDAVLRYYPVERIDRIVIVHLSDDEPYEAVLDSCPEQLRRKVTLASDLMTISL